MRENFRGIAQTISKRDINNSKNVVNTVMISEDSLLSHMDPFTLRNLLLHELTHACQVSRHVHEGPDTMDLFLYPTSGSTRAQLLDKLKGDVRSLAGQGTQSCIEQALASSMPAGVDETL